MTPASVDGSRRGGNEPITIALVNNMPDAALEATERQFRDLICAAAGDRAVELRVFSFPDLVRSDAARRYVLGHYEDVGHLWETHVDGLIVTGTEPRTPRIEREAYWPSLTRLVDWAAEHTTSTVWSCLAAHAAVAHLDGIEREPFPARLSGVFECARSCDHDVLAGMPACWRVPHSRLNTLSEARLTSAGYEVLSSSAEVGVDMFARRGKSLFLFLQGHPEYDAGALLREYQRDITRYLTGKAERYPDMPVGYLSDGMATAFCAFRHRALRHRTADLLGEMPDAAAPPAQPWRAPGLHLYANWLSELAG